MRGRLGALESPCGYELAPARGASWMAVTADNAGDARKIAGAR